VTGFADIDRLTDVLEAAGFIAARDDAEDLLTCAGGDEARLGELVERRLTGEPLAWIIGSLAFCGIRIRIDRGVYVPRWQTESLAQRAASYLPPDGVGVDICTGSGAVAKVMAVARPAARVVATDMDPVAVACAIGNGIEVYEGDLFAPLPDELRGCVDVVVAVTPYVPTRDLSLLPGDTFRFEHTLAYDGGVDGLSVVRRVVDASADFLRPGGRLLLELGGDEADILGASLRTAGFDTVEILTDEEEDVRGVDAQFGRAVPGGPHNG
jgi:release factor glutamine methyltransferase